MINSAPNSLRLSTCRELPFKIGFKVFQFLNFFFYRMFTSTQGIFIRMGSFFVARIHCITYSYVYINEKYGHVLYGESFNALFFELIKSAKNVFQQNLNIQLEASS